MPAVSDKQARMMRVALAIKLGKAKANKGPAAKAAKSMSAKQLREFTHTKGK